MTFTPILYSKKGQIEALPVILLCDYLGLSLELKSHCCLPEKCACTENQTCLQITETDCITNTGAQLRYLARSASSNLYDEKNQWISSVDAILDSFVNTLRDVTVLAQHLQGNCQLDSKCETTLRKNLTNGLKDLDNLLKANEKLPLNVADFTYFSTLGCLID